MGKVPGNYLLIIAGVIWFIAGANVANLGVQSYLSQSGMMLIWLGLAAVAVFIAFFRMFRKMVAKHTRRILQYHNAKTSVFNFFDARGYLIMIVMIVGGFGLRFLGVFPNEFIAFFYTGLGVALALSGVCFCCNFVSLRQSRKTSSSSIEVDSR